MPERIQRSRARGWRKPPGAVIVDRTSRWGNEYRVGDECQGLHGPVFVRDRAHAVQLHADLLRISPDLVAEMRRELAGKSLCCPCPLDEPCHADTLIRVAAGGEP